MKKRLCFISFSVAMLFAANTVFAQGDISSLFKAGVKDLNTIASGYMKPAGLGFASGLGSNWYNTAATHKLLGFDLTVGASVALVPSSDQMFDLSSLQNLKPTNAGITQAPTFGGSGDGVNLALKSGATTLANFTTPKGVSQYIPTPNLQFSLGLIKGTELSIRYTPQVKVSGMSTGLWGVGAKHDFKQWIPVVDKLPFDASAFVGYTKFNLDYAFDKQIGVADLGLTPGTYVLPAGNPIYGNQGFNINANALTANIIVSKKFLFFTPYVGFGFSKANFDMTFAGTYPIAGDVITTGANIGKVQVNGLTDPIKLSFSETMPSATVGFRLKMLMVLALHAQYTVQKYPTASVGFGINIR